MSKHTMDFDFRDAKITDLDRIAACAAEMRRDGHLINLHAAAQELGFRENLERIMRTQHYRDDGVGRLVRAQLLVFSAGRSAAGFLITRDIPTQVPITSMEYVMELWIAAIFQEQRGRGYGGQLIDLAIRGFGPKVGLIARCFPASSQMLHMLLKRGFRRIGHLQGTFELLALP